MGRGPRLLSRLPIALLAGGLLGPALGAAPLVRPVAAASTCPLGGLYGSVCAISSSQWKEDPGSQAVHIVGELRNDGGQNLTGIRIRLDLLDANGNVIGPDHTWSTVQVLGPGDRSPFEDILVAPPSGYHDFRIAGIDAGPSIAQPDHFAVTVGACTPADPSKICGTVTNTTGATVDNMESILTFYDGTGKTVAQDNAPVSAPSGSSALSPGETGAFAEDPIGFPASASYATVAEPDYRIDLNPAALSFADQVVGTSSPADHVTLTNNGPRALTVGGGIATTGDFSQTNNCGASLASQVSCVIDITFTPTATGSRPGTLAVTDDAAGSPQSIPLSGTGTMPIASLSPTSVAFGSRSVGATSPPQTVTLTNTGDGPMTVSAVTIDPNFSMTNGCPGLLAVGSHCDIAVTFTPGQVGDISGDLTITDNAAGSPQRVGLSGTGVGAGTRLDPGRLDFGNAVIGSTSDPRSIVLTNSGNAALTITSIAADGDFAATHNCPASLGAGMSCTIRVTFTPTALGSRTGNLRLVDNAGSQSAPLTGTGTGRPAATFSAASTQQYALAGNDGSTWHPIDAGQLTLTIPASPAPGTAILSGNADLWTQNAGVNQDLGIFVSVDGTADQLAAWKESGGFAGTFSPNAAFVQTSYALLPGKTYTVTLKWKTNKSTTGTIRAGAGIDPNFSPTTLTAQVLAAGVSSAVSTKQYTLSGNDGTAWQPIDATGLSLTLAPSTDGTVLLSGNADLWTQNAGVNQDIGIFVGVDGAADQLVAWKESGGFAGTFSPNAAFVQAAYPLAGGTSYAVTLKWKTNKATGGTIRAGAGLDPNFSPTTLTAEVVAAGVSSAVSTHQSTLTNNNGSTWQPIDGALTLTLPVSAGGMAILSGNADLWTQNAGVNQDIGIFVGVDGAPDQLVAWKESGGFAGTFSPNAAFVQTAYPLLAGKSYTVTLKWKTNKPTAGTIRAGAGLDPDFSPTSLAALIMPR